MTALPDLYLLRHGQTRWNAEGRLQGRQDSPLTALGLQQARRQAELVAALPRDLDCYSSPAGRAVQTAEIVLAGRSFQTDARLQEIDVGEFTGARETDLRRQHPDVFGDCALGWYDRTPQGEHFDALHARVSDFLHSARSPTLIITHGVTLRMLRLVAMGMPVERIGDLPVIQGGMHCIRRGAEEVLH